jgi:hypothetical protein
MSTAAVTITPAIIDVLFGNCIEQKPFDQYTVEQQQEIRDCFTNLKAKHIPREYLKRFFMEYLFTLHELNLLMKDDDHFADFIEEIASQFANYDNRDCIAFIRPYLSDDTKFYWMAVQNQNFELFKWLNENGYHRIYERDFKPEDPNRIWFYLDNRDIFENVILSGNVEACEYMMKNNLFPIASDFLFDYYQENKRDLKKNNKQMYQFIRGMLYD